MIECVLKFGVEMLFDFLHSVSTAV